MCHPQLMNGASGRFYTWGQTSGKKTSGNQESKSSGSQEIKWHSKTSRHFIVCCREHLGINRKGNSVKGAVKSAIKDHAKDTGRSASMDDFCIIDKANNELELLIHESLFILKDRPYLNFQSSTIPLCLF